MPRKLILYIAASLDGYIAKPGDDLSFLSLVERQGEDYGYAAFMAEVDTVILGRRTYDWVVEQVGAFPHADKLSYVLSRQNRPSVGQTHFYKGDLKELVQQLKARPGKHIFCDGGGQTVQALLQDKLIDEIIVSIIPILLGSGIRLFEDKRPEQNLQLLEVKHYDSGLCQLHYACLNT